MIQYILDVTLCWTILYIIFYAFLRQVTFFSINRYYLLGSLTIGLLLPVLRNLDISLNRPEVFEVVPLAVMIQQTPTYITQQIESHPLAEYWSYILICTYMLGVAFFLLRLVKGLNDIRWIYVTGEKVAKEDYTLVYSDQEHLPFSFGNVVYISKKIPLVEEINQIITHELNHVHSRHTLDVLYVELLNILFWFNPLIYLYKSAIKQTHEYLADAAVLHQTDKKMYGRILLRQSLSGIQIALAHSFFQSHIKNRINMMYQKKSGRWAWLKYALVLPLIAILAMAFTEVKKDSIDSQSKLDNKKEPKTYAPDESHVLVLKNGKRIPYDQYKLTYNELKQEHNGIEWMSSPNRINDLVKKYKVSLESEEAQNGFYLAINYFQSEFFYEHISNTSNYTIEITPSGKIIAHFQSDNNKQTPLLVIDQGNVPKLKVRFQKKGEHYIAEVMNKDLPKDGFRIRVDFEDYRNHLGIPVLRKEGKSLVSDERAVEEWKQHLIRPYDNKGNKFESSSLFNIFAFHDSKPDTVIHNDVDEMPLFPGCLEISDIKERKKCSDQKLLMYLYSNLKYPTEARKNKIQGRVYAQFIVEPDGMLSDINIVRDIGGGCGESVKDVIESMNIMEDTWIPGKQDGKNVRVKYTLPVSFKLEDNTKSDASTEKTIPKSDQTDNEIYDVVEEMPRFPGCEGNGSRNLKNCADELLLSYVYDNIVYPESARKQGISGRVYIQFIVDTDGTIDEAKVVRDIGGGCGEAALKMVESMIKLPHKWRPGYQKGKPVRVKYTLPVTFELTKDIDTLVMYDPLNNTKEAYRLAKEGGTSKLMTPLEHLKLKKYANFNDVFRLADFRKANLDPSKVLIRLGGNQYFHSDTARRFRTKDLSEITIYNQRNGKREFGDLGENGIVDMQLVNKYLDTEEVFDVHQSEGNSIEISFTSSSDLPIELILTDMNGRNIETRTININTAGKKMMTTLNDLQMSSGLYAITLKQGSDLRSKKISYISK